MKRTVRNYEELRRWADAFSSGRFEVFILVGNPGLGKSRVLKEKMDGKARVVEGRTTAFELYRELYRHRDKPFIIDDVDQLYSDKDAVRLLKCLCQTEPVKDIAWHSATPKLEKEGIPTEFDTRTKVAIIANEWKELNANIGAVEDRGILIHFQPTAKEVHRWIGVWNRKQKISREIYEFVGEHLHLISEPSARHYITAEHVRKAKLDWQSALYETWGLTEDVIVAAKLLADASLTQEQRCRAFIRRTKKSRPTYFRIIKEWRTGAG